MKRYFYVIISAILITVIVIIANTCTNESPSRPSESPSSVPETKPEPTSPAPPNNLTAEPMSTSIINLYWTDNSNNEEGFRVYRDTSLIAKLPVNTTIYQDTSLNQATTYQYRVTAFNQMGETSTQVITVKTPNPPITVKLNRIGAHDNGEEFIRDNDGGEVYIGVVVTDGETTRELKLPTIDGQFFTLYDDDSTDIETTIFSTDEVGSYLRIAILGYESDGGAGEKLLYDALSIAASAYLTGGAATILGIDSGLSDLIGRLFGGDDDYLGSYEKGWEAENNWGIGTYSDIPCYMKDGTIGLRLWFTIEMK